MNYRFASERQDYSDLASGRVLYSLPGRPALPVRLADELFQRCLTVWRAAGDAQRVRLYDPCCGAGYHLSVIAMLHVSDLDSVIGSDVDAETVQVASRNLGLLSVAGLDGRVNELQHLVTMYDKASHKDALQSAEKLRAQLQRELDGRSLVTDAFVADALDGEVLHRRLGANAADIVVTDVPYGWHSQWSTPMPSAELKSPMWHLLEALRSILEPTAVVGVVFDKQQKVQHDAFRRIEHFQVGKRRAAILKLAV